MQTDFMLEPGITPLEIARKRRLAEALMREATDTSPVRHWTQGAARLAQALRGVQEDWGADKEQRKYDAYGSSLGSELDGMPAGAAPSALVGALAGGDAKVPAFAAQGVSPSYMGNMAAKEGGTGANSASIVNPKSGATGVFQFMPSTWNGLAATMPELGLTRDGMKDPKQQQVAMQAFTGQNAKALSSSGIPVNDATLALAHQQGAGGAKALLGNPGMNVVDALLPAYKGNRAIATQAVVNNGGDPRMTAGQFAQKVQGYYTGGAGQQTMVGGDNLGQQGPSPQRLMAIMSDPRAPPQIRERAKMMYQEAQKNTGPEAELRRLQIEKARRDINAPAPDNRPSAIREYEYARQNGFTGSFEDYKARGAPRTEGAIPGGMRAVRDAQGNIVQLEPIPGSKEAQAASQATAAEAARKRGEVRKSNNVIAAIDDIEKNIKGATLATTGLMGSGLSKVGGTAANNVRSLIDTVKANLSFESLNAMRKESPTGAALGAVSDTEIRLLGATVASLDQSQDEAQFLKNLARVKEQFQEIINGPPKAAPGGVDPETWKLMTPEERALWP